ncbi:hypothetical protein G3N55_06725, partial [Dissulfurirhabdus thermomarina]
PPWLREEGDNATGAANATAGRGPGGLRYFGYDLFAGVPSTFAPATDIPVPADYVVGPGDTVQVQLFGKENADYTLVVTREGLLHLPGIGPVPVAGLRFEELRRLVRDRIARQMIGVKAGVTMGPLRSIRVFLLGEAFRPGSYTVSALSTMTNALFVGGGVALTGSLRDIQLKRQGKVVGRIDLYDLLLRGDTSSDARLQPGDVIFVPPVGARVWVAGEVKRPAVYELRGERTVGEAVALAGGLLPTADPSAVRVERISDRRERTLIDVDLAAEAGRAVPVQDGDRVRVPSVLAEMEDVVWLAGHVQRPGGYQWQEGMRVTDLVPSAYALKPRADLGYVLVRRERQPERFVEVFSVDLRRAFAERGGPADVPLRPRDTLYVFASAGDRAPVVDRLLGELAAQARHGAPLPEVAVGGRVRAPGRYPLEPGMRVSDLIRAGGDLQEAAYALEAELTRYEVVKGAYRQTAHVPVDLAAVLRGDPAADLALRPHDYLNVKEIPRWRKQERVEVGGEVRFPGSYAIRRGETLSSVIRRAGGLTDLAYPRGAVFLRASLRAKEQEQMDRMARRLRADLSSISLRQVQEDPKKAQALDLARSLAEELESTNATGRMVIDLPGILAGRADKDVVLENGDRLLVPRRPQEVSVIGEVFYPTSHLYDPALSRNDYIQKSGGFTQKADPGRVYVVRADGSVLGSSTTLWFIHTYDRRIEPGDTIVVPLDAERIRPLALFGDVTEIIYRLALAAAAANAVGAF